MIISKVLSSLVLLSQFSVVSCGGDNGPSGATSSTGGASSVGGGSSVGGSAPVDQGKVVLMSSQFSGTFHPGRVYATFTRAVDSPNCVVTQFGDCSTTNCGASPSTIAWPDAGTISFASQQAGMNVQLERGTAGAYNQTSLGSGIELSDGDDVKVSSAGGSDIPSFQASMTFPSTLTMTSPDIQSVSQDVVFTWTGGSSNVDFVVQANGLGCVVSADKHSLTVPKELLSANEGLSIAAMTTKSVTAGSYSISILLLTGVLNSAKTGEYKPGLTE